MNSANVSVPSSEMANPDCRTAPLQTVLGISSDGSVPNVLEDPFMYTETEISNRIHWVKDRQTRDLTPLSEAFLLLYLDKLEDVSKTRSIGAIGDVQHYERKMKWDRLLIEVPDMNLKTLIQNSKDLIRYRMLGRYGDYLAKTLAMARSEVLNSTDIHPSIPESFTRYWTEVHAALLEDQDIIKEARARGRLPSLIRTPTIAAIKKAASCLLFNEDQLISAITLYAERNHSFHGELNKIIAGKQAPKLAQTIFHDLKYLDIAFKDSAFHDTATRIADELRPIIESFRDTFFNIPPQHKNTPDMWGPTSKFDEVVLNEPPIMISEKEWDTARKRLRAISEGSTATREKAVERINGWFEGGRSPKKRAKIAGL